jgi:hypothetical protein
MKETSHSDYIVYADESGDLSFEDKEYPVFVLAFCIFSKREYLTDVVRHIKGLKFAKKLLIFQKSRVRVLL